MRLPAWMNRRLARLFPPLARLVHASRRRALRRLGLRDAARIEQTFPLLAESREREAIARELEGAHTDYLAEVSSEDMAVSLETACLLAGMCRQLKPERILDLGSGFSSLVLRRYQPPGAVTISVDDDARWLARTQAYLRAQGAAAGSLLEWREGLLRDLPACSLVFYDLGSMVQRARCLPEVVEACRAWQAVLVLDDMHQHAYRRAVDGLLSGHRCRRLSARELTADRFGRHAEIVTDWASDPRATVVRKQGPSPRRQPAAEERSGEDPRPSAPRDVLAGDADAGG